MKINLPDFFNITYFVCCSKIEKLNASRRLAHSKAKPWKHLEKSKPYHETSTAKQSYDAITVHLAN